jgi:hypothetical protein
LIPDDEAYVVDVRPRVDTVAVDVEDLGDHEPRWAVCSPAHFRSLPGHQAWSFLQESRRWPKPIQWKPADATWERIRALADSLADR